jgi:Family of unknown function (DUF6152)
MKLKIIACCGVLAMLAAGQLMAHHSFAAEYDSTKVLKLTGAITKVDWSNPHVYFFIDVKDAATGKVNNWAFEMAAPAVLQRSGWKKSMLSLGELVTVEGTAAKNGTFHGNARNVVLTNTGQKLGAGSSEGVN